MANATARKIEKSKNNVNMEKVNQHLKDQVAKGATTTNVKAPDVNDVIDDRSVGEDGPFLAVGVATSEEGTPLVAVEDNDEMTGDVEELIDEIIKDVDPKKSKKISWWASLPKKERFNSGDIVYDTSIKHFSIFVEPAKKEGLVKLRLFKLGTKFDVYTRDWYLEFDNIQLVKRGEQMKRGFAESENEFLLKGRPIVKIKEEKNAE